ncbi:MAG: hypothetical protein HOP11_11900 [Saprospiraceae bacterium]|nr:hypothetical protein [Saprospiraceae bacterium]
MGKFVISTCKNGEYQFNLKAYYIKLLDFQYIFKPIFQPFKSYKVKISDICFQVPDELNIHLIDEGIHYATEKGIFLTIVELTAKHSRANPPLQSQIVQYLKENIEDAFKNYFILGNRCSISMGAGVCPGISGRKTTWCL